ncbi:transcriptional regulator ATRX homolog [Hibiscus syriacus]|uniref:transcriptional regulator ATRX homolog n=1 Tax=Hibiscus syriacus TaxID=106335 RepID=UPI0019213BEB|nr:transcriptional regulator ATRX homolog [Hibiscus syriacus]
MGKSSSLKKKRSKDSSLSPTMKRRLSKESKSKKLGRPQDDSVSYSSDNEPVSSYSSEDDCRSQRSRSCYRKSRKKRSSRETCEDSPYVKKRRGSGRGGRKRTRKRKKSTRGGSVNSSSSQVDSDKIEYEKRRGRSEKKEKYGRSETVKRGNKRSKGQSRSSSCSRYSEGSDYLIEERVMEDGNSRRLKSFITVVEQVNGSFRELFANEPKEDVYDHDDYPSCRSNDSNDGCGEELWQHTHTVSEMIKPPDDEQVEVSNVRTSNAEEINVCSATDRR